MKKKKNRHTVFQIVAHQRRVQEDEKNRQQVLNRMTHKIVYAGHYNSIFIIRSRLMSKGRSI